MCFKEKPIGPTMIHERKRENGKRGLEGHIWGDKDFWLASMLSYM